MYGGRGTYGKGAPGGSVSIIPQPVVMAPGSTTATVSWEAVEGATGYEVFTGPSATGPWTSKGTTTGTSKDLAGLAADTTTYAAVQATVVSDKGVVTFVTAQQLYSYEPVTFTGLHSDGLTLTGTQTFVLAHKNTSSAQVLGVQIEGLSRLTEHATILGVTIGSGTVNTTAFTATRWEQATRGGSTSWTPSPGAWTTPSWWVTDDVLNVTAVPQNGWFLVKIVAAVGSVSVPHWNQAEARWFSSDTKSAQAAGDYGSTPALAATSPGAWTTDTVRGGPCFTLRLRRAATSQADVAFIFGDSLAMGEAGFIYYDRWNSTANSLLTSGRRVVPAGVGQQNTTQIAATFMHWLANSPDRDTVRVCGLMGISWNGTVTTPIEAAMDAGIAAGKRMFIYIPSPSALVYNGKGDHAVWVAARQRYIDLGYTVVETWPNVTDVDGATIKASMTPDGIHLNTSSGQVVQGTDFAAAQSVIFA